jgi:hypothetical protein
VAIRRVRSSAGGWPLSLSKSSGSWSSSGIGRKPASRSLPRPAPHICTFNKATACTPRGSGRSPPAAGVRGRPAWTGRESVGHRPRCARRSRLPHRWRSAMRRCTCGRRPPPARASMLDPLRSGTTALHSWTWSAGARC